MRRKGWCNKAQTFSCCWRTLNCYIEDRYSKFSSAFGAYLFTSIQSSSSTSSNLVQRLYERPIIRIFFRLRRLFSCASQSSAHLLSPIYVQPRALMIYSYLKPDIKSNFAPIHVIHNVIHKELLGLGGENQLFGDFLGVEHFPSLHDSTSV